MIMDMVILKKFLSGMPCKICLKYNTDVSVSPVIGFSQKNTITCNACFESYGFKSSAKLENVSATKQPYDVNRRIIQTFSSMGKGHMALETFSIGMNMPCISHLAYDKHITNLSKECEGYRKVSKI
uniref:Mutator-like transposase domain-containing protein n=1 Tax=Clastoptera arizonana TaxID=38151 RepID=A0A1B6CRJ9_9HEMI